MFDEKVNLLNLSNLQYYRARYGSEGVRAPLKGRTENFPTVEVRISS